MSSNQKENKKDWRKQIKSQSKDSETVRDINSIKKIFK